MDLAHISTKTSKHGPVAFGQTEIQGFKVFGTFQLSFGYQSATNAYQSGHTEGVKDGDPFPGLK